MLSGIGEGFKTVRSGSPSLGRFDSCPSPLPRQPGRESELAACGVLPPDQWFVQTGGLVLGCCAL